MPNSSAQADDWQDVPLDDWQDVSHQDPYLRAKEALSGMGGALMSGVNAVTSTVDKYTGAPMRAAVGAAQNGEPIGAAFANQFTRPASTAPTGKEIMAKLGLSEEDMNTPLISNPFTGEHFKVSPAGVAGGIAETALDPTTYLGLGEAKGAELAGRALERAAPVAGEGLAHLAEERAVKAATGENRTALKKAARINGQSAGDVDHALANLHSTGRTLLEADEAGAPAVGWLDNSRGIAENAAAKRQYYGQKIGSIGDLVEQLVPEGIQGPDLARDVHAYSATIPNVGQGATLRERLLKEGDQLQELGPLSFRDAQKVKAQYPFKPEAADALISNQDATNAIHGIVNKKMDEAAAKASAMGTNVAEGQFNPVPLAASSLGMSEEDALAKLNSYGDAKKRYGTYKGVADAGTEQTLRTLGRRVISPSSHAIGLAGGVAESAQKGLEKGGLLGFGAAIANQVALSRGSAFAARSADAISKKILASPQVYQKWLPTLQKAAVGGNAALVATHHQLMENDPVYRQIMTENDTAKAEEQ